MLVHHSIVIIVVDNVYTDQKIMCMERR